MRSVCACCCRINEIFNKTKKSPLPYCNDLMSVPVAPGHVGGKVSRWPPPQLHFCIPPFLCTCIPTSWALCLPDQRAPPFGVCIQTQEPNGGFNYHKMLSAFSAVTQRMATQSSLRLSTRGPLVNWVIDLDCLTDPCPGLQKKAKFKNPPRLNREVCRRICWKGLSGVIRGHERARRSNGVCPNTAHLIRICMSLFLTLQRA